MKRRALVKILQYSIVFVFLTIGGFLAFRGIHLIESAVDVGVAYAKSLPQPKIEERSGEPSQIYDRNGNFLYELHGDIRRRNVDLIDVPIHVQNAFIAAEDHSFYTHSGVSVKNLIASIQENISESEIERGASTIPMQLARTLVLSNDQTAERKIKEIIIAYLSMSNIPKIKF